MSCDYQSRAARSSAVIVARDLLITVAALVDGEDGVITTRLDDEVLRGIGDRVPDDLSGRPATGSTVAMRRRPGCR